MADPPAPSLSRAREQKISELSTLFANDDLSLDDLERRIERVYKATNVAELDAITADLKSASVPSPPEMPRGSVRALGRRSKVLAPAGEFAESARILSFMSSTRRVGRWEMPRKLAAVAIMSDTKIDLTQATIPSGVVEIDLHVVMASFRLIVPPGMRVISHAHAIMSSIRSRADDAPTTDVPATANAPVIQLTGYALMSDVSIVVRRREDPVYDDDDDD